MIFFCGFFLFFFLVLGSLEGGFDQADVNVHRFSTLVHPFKIQLRAIAEDVDKQNNREMDTVAGRLSGSGSTCLRPQENRGRYVDKVTKDTNNSNNHKDQDLPGTIGQSMIKLMLDLHYWSCLYCLLVFVD